MNNNLLIVGTHHLMEKSEIESIIKKENPDIIGVELDEIRLNNLLNPPIEQETNDDSLSTKVVKGLKKMAEKQQMQYGSDMLNASKYAIENKIPLLLVDEDIRNIQYKFSKLPDNEKAGFLQELSELEKQTAQEVVNEVKDNSNIDDYMNKFKEKYPIGFMVLVEMRDLFISYKILKCIKDNQDKKILCFVGKGHEKGIKNLLGIE